MDFGSEFELMIAGAPAQRFLGWAKGNSLTAMGVERLHMMKWTAIYSALLIATTGLAGPSPGWAAGQTVEIYSAGSLRGVVGELAREAVLSNRPQAMRIALFLLSRKGQAIIAQEGLVPLLDPGTRP